MVYGTLGPLLVEPRLQYVKGYYQRPIVEGGVLKEGGGGRVTELVARPLINLFFPELSGLIQPLSGEYAGRRTLLEQIPFFTGYAVEIGHLIDAAERVGIEGLGQVDLERRIHRNQELEGLSRMSFVILQAVMKRLEERRRARLFAELGSTMKLPRSGRGRLSLEVHELADHERPPMIRIPEYLEKRRQAVRRATSAGGPTLRRLRHERTAPLRVLIAPDSFKGSLTSVEVARALADGLAARPGPTTGPPRAARRRRRGHARRGRGGGRLGAARGRVHDPLGRPIRARWLPGTTARRRSSRWRGVRAVARRGRRSATRRARRATGPGDVLRGRAGRRDPRRSCSGIGGSATTDGGAGLLRALGRDGPRTWPPWISAASTRGWPRSAAGRVRRDEPAARTERGAAAVYGPQKGATPATSPSLDARLARLADALEAATRPATSATRRAPAPPAASASGCCALADRVRRLRLGPGIDLVMAATGFDAALARRGSRDHRRGPDRRADGLRQDRAGGRAAGAGGGQAVIAVGGGVTPEGDRALAARRRGSPSPVTRRPMTLEEAMAAGSGPVRRCGERIARLIALGEAERVDLVH